FQTAHSGHANIQNNAVCFPHSTRIPKKLGGCKSRYAVARRSQERSSRVPDRLIVVHHGDRGWAVRGSLQCVLEWLPGQFVTDGNVSKDPQHSQVLGESVRFRTAASIQRAIRARRVSSGLLHQQPAVLEHGGLIAFESLVQPLAPQVFDFLPSPAQYRKCRTLHTPCQGLPQSGDSIDKSSIGRGRTILKSTCGDRSYPFV